MNRELLPARRNSVTFDFEHSLLGAQPWHYRATLGYYDDGRLGEIFLNSTKVGTGVDVAVKDSAILISFALQHGVTADAMRSSMTRDAEGRPEGVMGTLLDLICGPEFRR